MKKAPRANRTYQRHLPACPPDKAGIIKAATPGGSCIWWVIVIFSLGIDRFFMATLELCCKVGCQHRKLGQDFKLPVLSLVFDQPLNSSSRAHKQINWWVIFCRKNPDSYDNLMKSFRSFAFIEFSEFFICFGHKSFIIHMTYKYFSQSLALPFMLLIVSFKEPKFQILITCSFLIGFLPQVSFSRSSHWYLES